MHPNVGIFDVRYMLENICRTHETHLENCHFRSFAYKTISERMPVILTKVIDLLHREKADIGKQYGDVSCLSKQLKSVSA